MQITNPVTRSNRKSELFRLSDKVVSIKALLLIGTIIVLAHAIPRAEATK